MRNTVPLVGITCRGPEDLPEHHNLYEKAVVKAGGRPLFIPPGRALQNVSSACDGFIIPGGRDPAPTLYNERKTFHIDLEDPRRVSFELMLLREIMRLRKPVLGICYGMQVLNIFFGGNLYQDIRAQVPENLNHEKEMHSITVTDNPHIESGRFLVNSRHHQAIKVPGKGVVPFAFAPDGITEAFYLADHGFFLGVQWHPEGMESPASAMLFGSFIGACRDKQ